ncbi:hypothetical protein [Hamadaea sp.]|uniref:SCO6745 family protein n=1 Tax=Hamadaea sp. TaxID=2024425 RepID=UPI0025C42324|nr:hypothetical protein [Hamadaea sp.]
MWTLFEPLHAVTYFAPEAREHFEAAGLRGFWRGYFAGRAAVLGPVGPAPVVAAFFGFAPATVARALPDVWSRATPAAALEARQAGAVASLRALLADFDAEHVAEAAELLSRAAAAAEPAGRMLGAANLAVPMPAEPYARLWQSATTLREHRGDGHVAALVTAGLDGCESLAWRSGLDLSRQTLQPARGWTDDEWDAAVDRLRRRGWLTSAATATTSAIEAYRRIEGLTDEAAMRPWHALGSTDRLVELLTPLARAAARAIPDVNPIGLPRV